MSTIESQKKVADEVIKKLRAVDPYCIVAGGAPRDWYFGEVANDIDIYIWQQHSTHKSKIYQLNCAGFDVSPVRADTFEFYEKNAMIEAVFNVKDCNGDIQIISLNKATYNVVDTFPFSICQVWYTPERGIQPEKNFKITEKTGYIAKLRRAADEL